MQNEELIQQIELSRLKPFPDHPFQVRDDDAMQQTVESITNYGVLVPGIARPLDDGNFEIISGHRRKHACELAGLSTMPVIVRNLSIDEATIIMVDSNLQRENILPSERAKAYKMKLEAIKRQGIRTDLTSPQVAAKFRADDEEVVDRFGMERTAVVLVATVQDKDWDGRIDMRNKEWAKTIPVPNDRNFYGEKHSREFVCHQAHPGLINIFVNCFRKEQERVAEKKPSVLQKLNEARTDLSPKAHAKQLEIEL